MWIATAERLPSPGQKVFFTTGPIVYRASFQPCQVRPSDDGPLWLSHQRDAGDALDAGGGVPGRGAGAAFLIWASPFARHLRHFAAPSARRLTHILTETCFSESRGSNPRRAMNDR